MTAAIDSAVMFWLVSVDVGEDRVRAGQHDAAGRCEEAAGRDDDLVAGADAEDPQGKLEGERAVGQGDRVRDPVVGGELLLEPAALVAGPVVDLAGSQDPRRGVHVGVVVVRPGRQRRRPHARTAGHRERLQLGRQAGHRIVFQIISRSPLRL